MIETLQTPKLDPKALTVRWYALYTRSRHEKFIDTELTRRRIESFLPVRSIKKRWSDRTVTVEEPLFKSYLFVKTDPLHFMDVLKTKGAVKLVTAAGLPVAIDERVIASLKQLISKDIAIDPFPYLAVGDRVSVRSGIFKGVEGFIVKKDDKKCRLVVSITAILASISVEIDSYLVERI